MHERTHESAGSATATREFDCRDLAALLSGLIDDVVSPVERHAAERHMAGCRACAAMLTEAEEIEASLARTMDRGDDLPVGFEDAVLAATVGGARPAGRVFRFVAASGWLAAAASIVLAVVLNNQSWQPAGTGGSGYVRNDDSAALANGADDRSGDRGDRGDTRRERAGSTAGGSGNRTGLASVYTPGREMLSRVDDSYQPSRRDVQPAAAPATSESSGENGSVPLVATPRRPFMFFTRPGAAETATAAGDSPQGADAKPTLSREDEDVLYAVSSLLDTLVEETDESSMRVAEDMRRRIESDRVLERLGAARLRLQPQDQAVILAAESILYRIVYGPVSLADLREMRSAVQGLNITREIDRMIGKVNPNRTM
jgi:hypothetical protein